MTAHDALKELIEAIDKRWEGESERKRANAISPSMEEAMVAARKALASPPDVSLPWQVGAYIKLGVERDKMDPAHVAIVQDFIGPNPTSDTDSEVVKK